MKGQIFDPGSRYSPVLLVIPNGDRAPVVRPTIRWNDMIVESDPDGTVRGIGFLVTVPSPNGHGPGANLIFNKSCMHVDTHAEAMVRMKSDIQEGRLPVVWKNSDECPLCTYMRKPSPGERMRSILSGAAAE